MTYAYAFALCLSFLSDPTLSPTVAARGCRLSLDVVEAAEAQSVPAPILAAIAWRESRFNPDVVSRVGACGAWQVIPRYVEADDCVGVVEQGADAGADMLRRWLRRKKTFDRALQAYAGCSRKRCPWYSGAVLDRARAWGYDG